MNNQRSPSETRMSRTGKKLPSNTREQSDRQASGVNRFFRSRSRGNSPVKKSPGRGLELGRAKRQEESRMKGQILEEVVALPYSGYGTNEWRTLAQLNITRIRMTRLYKETTRKGKSSFHKGDESALIEFLKNPGLPGVRSPAKGLSPALKDAYDTVHDNRKKKRQVGLFLEDVYDGELKYNKLPGKYLKYTKMYKNLKGKFNVQGQGEVPKSKLLAHQLQEAIVGKSMLSPVKLAKNGTPSKRGKTGHKPAQIFREPMSVIDCRNLTLTNIKKTKVYKSAKGVGKSVLSKNGDKQQLCEAIFNPSENQRPIVRKPRSTTRKSTTRKSKSSKSRKTPEPVRNPTTQGECVGLGISKLKKTNLYKNSKITGKSKWKAENLNEACKLLLNPNSPTKLTSPRKSPIKRTRSNKF